MNPEMLSVFETSGIMEIIHFIILTYCDLEFL